MSTTKEIVDDNRDLVDGSSDPDPLVIRRWTRAVQRAVNIIWNDRPWPWKIYTDPAFAFSAGGSMPLPSDFGGVEAEGSGPYSVNPKSALRPMSLGEITMAKNGLNLTTQAFGVWTRWGIDGSNLLLWPPIPNAVTFPFVYLRMRPNCVYESTPSLDQLSRIPSQWHDLISDGARYFNDHDVASNQETDTQAMLKLGLDQMRAREIQLGQNMILPYRRSRMRG